MPRDSSPSPSQQCVTSYLSESNFVSYPAANTALQQTAEAVVLRGLADDRVGAATMESLVSISLHGFDSLSLGTYAKTLGKRALCFKVNQGQESMGDILFPSPAYLPRRQPLRGSVLALDEAYIHSVLAVWENKSELEKLLITANGMPADDTWAFTVNFGERRLKSLSRDVSTAFKKIRNELASLSALGPVLATLEFDPDGRLHMHGMLVTDAPKQLLREVLLKIGGKSSNQAFTNLNQIDIRPATSPSGWVMYMTKGLIDLPASESGSLIYASQSAKRCGRDHLAQMRLQVEKKLGVSPEWRGRSSVYQGNRMRMVRKRRLMAIAN